MRRTRRRWLKKVLRKSMRDLCMVRLNEACLRMVVRGGKLTKLRRRGVEMMIIAINNEGESSWFMRLKSSGRGGWFTAASGVVGVCWRCFYCGSVVIIIVVAVVVAIASVVRVVAVVVVATCCA